MKITIHTIIILMPLYMYTGVERRRKHIYFKLHLIDLHLVEVERRCCSNHILENFKVYNFSEFFIINFTKFKSE